MKKTALIAVAVLLLGLLNGVAFASHQYSDVPTSNVHHPGVTWVTDEGVMEGFSDGTFRPGNDVSRGQLATTIQRLYDLVIAPADADLQDQIDDLEARVATLEGGDPDPTPSPTPSPTPDPSPTPTEEPTAIACEGSVTGSRTINSGGTYNVNVDTAGDGVTVTTTQPVTLTGCIEADGQQINVDVAGADVTVDHLRGTWTEQSSASAWDGRFLVADSPDRIQVLDSEIIDSEGIRIDNGTSAVINVLRNDVSNIRQIGSQQSPYAQFVQLANVASADVEIAHNTVLNEPGESSVEDIVNIYQSSGTSGNPIHIHDNDFDGAYPMNPNDTSYSGGGIMGGDGASNPTRHVLIEDNRVVRTTNYGIAFASGSADMIARNNCVIHPQADIRPANNIGMYSWNLYGDGNFGGQEMTNNTVGWYRDDGVRNDWWFPDIDNSSGNQSVSGTVTDTSC